MGKLQDAMRFKLETLGYAENTIEAYISHVRVFARHFGKSPLEITTDEIEQFLHFLRTQNKSEATVHMYYMSINRFYRLNDIDDRMPQLSFNRTRRKLPRILSQEKMISMLQHCNSLRFRTLFTLAYSSGMRLSEMRNLRLEDLDFDRKQVFVRNSKNGGSRYAILGHKTIALLKTYMNVFKPGSWLFYNMEDTSARISKDAIRRQFRRMLAENGVDADGVTLHTLRHCFATHLMESGVSIFHIMHLLGHANIQATMVYLHLQDLQRFNITSPIDMMEVAPPQETTEQKQLFATSA